MNLNEFFGKVYCVNLDRRSDRWEQVTNTFPDINIDRVSAVDGTNLQFKHPKLMPSEIGCTMSHLNILKMFMDTNEAKCLIVEDDIVPLNNDWNLVFWNAVLSLEEHKWDLFYLGANHVTPPNRIHGSLGKPTRAYSTCAYGVSREGAEYLLNNVTVDKAQIDVQYATINRGRYFCTVPNVFSQRPDFSDVQGGWVDYTTAFDPTKLM